MYNTISTEQDRSPPCFDTQGCCQELAGINIWDKGRNLQFGFLPASEQALIFWHLTVQLLPRQSYLVYAGSACPLADVPCGRSTKNQDCSLSSPLPTPHSMSNSLAIATVTATLQRLLQRAIAEDFTQSKNHYSKTGSIGQ